MIKKLFKNIFSSEVKELKRYTKRAEKILELSKKYDEKTTEELQQKLKEIKNNIRKEKEEKNINITNIYYENDKDKYKKEINNILDKYINDVYAIVRVLSKRILNMEHFKVQIIGGLVLNEGKIAEMKTGEGKTLVATLPAVLNGFFDKVYVITVNDYLVKRDATLMKPLYEACGLSVGYINPDMSPDEKKENYSKDIVYISNTEFGFDYLRNNIAHTPEEQVQPIDYFFCIIDEVDSVLIDEARTPLIISGPADKNKNLYKLANDIVKKLKLNEDFTINKEKKEILLTEKGYDKIEGILNRKIWEKDKHTLEEIKNEDDIILMHYINQGIFAHYFMENGKHYIVKDDKIYLIDEYTGRIAEGRQYSEGLHQMLEVKEGLEPSEETVSYAEITYQMLFKIFVKIAGMTGTALTEASEFYNIYGLSVIPIPTNKPVIRKDLNDLFYFTKEQKYNAIIEKIQELYKKGQPVLVGTTSVEESELISNKLKKLNIPHNVLNAKNHEREAEIIAQAGKEFSVTVATNMAGRGTDIKLTEKSKKLDGLYVIGASRNENRRIDNQLIGRSGRQGDPGVSQFYLSAEDELISIFASPGFKKRIELLGKSATKEDFLDSKLVTKIINSAQDKIKKLNFEVRKNIYEYDKVFEIQRSKIYKERNKILHKKFNFDEKIKEYLKLFTQRILENINNKFILDTELEKLKEFVNGKEFEQGELAEWKKEEENIPNISNVSEIDLAAVLQYVLYKEANFLISYKFLSEELEKEYNIKNTKGIDDIIYTINSNMDTLSDFIYKLLYSYINDKFKNISEEEKNILLSHIFLKVLDENWLKHINLLDIIKEGIGLRGYNQKDPLDEYKKESYNAFMNMLEETKLSFIKELLKIYPEDFMLFNKEFIEDDTDILNYNLNNADIEKYINEINELNIEEIVKNELEKYITNNDNLDVKEISSNMFEEENNISSIIGKKVSDILENIDADKENNNKQINLTNNLDNEIENYVKLNNKPLNDIKNYIHFSDNETILNKIKEELKKEKSKKN